MTDQQLPQGGQDLRERAMARLKEKRDFGAHLFIYLVVNGFLIGIWAFTGAGFFWPVFPLSLWGIGLVLTAWDVYWRKPVSEGRIRREIERMREFGLGRYVLGSPWSDLLASYNLSDGRIWALVPVWMGFGPAALQRLRTIRS